MPLIIGIDDVASAGRRAAAPRKFSSALFGEIVFHRGPTGIGSIWGCAGIGLLIGGALAHTQPRLSFAGYKHIVALCYLLHGGSYVLFSQAHFAWALVFIALSRVAVGVSSVLNMSQLLRHVADDYRGRVFSTIESVQWSVMMVSMMLAGIASNWDPRTIGSIAGALSSTTAIFWGWAHVTGRLPEPARDGVEPEEIEVHGEPAV